MYKIVPYLIFVFSLAISCCECVQSECDNPESCLDKKLVSYVDQIDQSSLVGEYLSLVKTDQVVEKKNPEEGFIERCVRFLEEHELRLRMPPTEARSLEIGARSSRLRRFLLPILLFLKLKAAIIIPIVLSIIALVAFNGLGAGVTALAISGAVALKALLENHAAPPKISYEIMPQVAAAPQWSRSGFVEPNLLISPLGAGYHTIA